jgi:hypothetical protein
VTVTQTGAGVALNRAIRVVENRLVHGTLAGNVGGLVREPTATPEKLREESRLAGTLRFP